MTKFSKVLVVVTTVACLAWLGFVLVAREGGTNWRAIARELETEYGYQITRAEGANAVWEAKRMGAASNIASDPSLPKVIQAVQNDIKQEQQRKLSGNPTEGIAGLESQVTSLQAQLAEAQRLEAIDVAALEEYIAGLEAQLTQVEQDLKAIVDQIAAATQEAKQNQDLATLRRGDVHRLRQLLQELEADRDRLAGQQQRLRDWIQQGRLDVRDLEARAKQAGLETDPAVTAEAEPALR